MYAIPFGARQKKPANIEITAVELHFVSPGGVADAGGNGMAHAVQPLAKITLPWAAPSFAAVKGIVQAPSHLAYLAHGEKHAQPCTAR